MINLILYSRYGDEYEIVAGGGMPLSSCGCRYDADDFTYTRQFIATLLISPQAWRNLLQRLGYSLPPNIHHPAEMLDVVTRFCLRGVLAFYKLPRIESLQALSSGEGWGICLVKGPNPHCHSELEIFEVGTPEEAEALLDSVSASERDLVRVMIVNNMTHWFSFDGNTRNKVIQMLAKRELLAYKVEVEENAPASNGAGTDYVAAAGPGYDKVTLGPVELSAPVKQESIQSQLHQKVDNTGMVGGNKTTSASKGLPEWLKARFEAGNEFNRVNRARYPFNEVEVVDISGRKFRVDSYDPVVGEIISRKYTQLGEIKPETGIEYLQELARKYPAGAAISNSPFNSRILQGTRIQGDLILEVPAQKLLVPQKVLDYASTHGMIIRDEKGVVH